MSHETYTPGHSQNAMEFMSARTLESHGQFFVKYLDQSQHLLDVGCGPGTITVGLARRVASVHAIDLAASQTEIARQYAEREQLQNVTFKTGSCYELPYDDQSFDRVFSHALLEHLGEPVRALAEFRRVLKPGGVVGVCSPDFGGRMLIPPSPEVEQAAEAYAQLQSNNGGDLNAGRKLGSYLSEAGFGDIALQARYECYPSLEFISEYLALQLEQAEMSQHAACLREWRQYSPGMFAHTWVSAVGTRT
ncbi:MAG: class I SAM-dependent methyltransferase [Planctomycetaceae bacterium]